MAISPSDNAMATSSILKTIAAVIVFLLGFVLVDILTHIVIEFLLFCGSFRDIRHRSFGSQLKFYLVEYVPDLCGDALGVYAATIFTRTLFKEIPAKAIFWSFIGVYCILLTANFLMSDISSSLQEVLIRPAIWTIEASVAAWYFLLSAKPIILMLDLILSRASHGSKICF